jgi:hypothetical protein
MIIIIIKQTMYSIQKTKCVECKVNYGSDERKGMCSVCFKESKNKEAVKEEIKLKETTEETRKDEEAIIKENKDVAMEVSKPVQTNPLACWKCDKKVGYLGFKCKCGYVYCGTHRHFSDHGCDFDYKSYDRNKLIKNSIDNKSDDKMIK